MIEYVSLNEYNLEAVNTLSNRNLEFDNVSFDIFRFKTLQDPNFDPAMAIVAMSGGKPCGYMMGVCRDNGDSISAAVKFFAVDKEFRGQKIANEMLKIIKREAEAKGAKSLGVGFIRPNYLTPGIDTRYTAAIGFLIRRGFERRGENFNMDIDLSASDWSSTELEEKLAKDNIICRRLQADEKEKFGEWMIADGFSTGWRYQVMRAAEQDPIAVFIAEKDGQYLAFAGYDGVRPRWFGPMGTSQNLRGGGIGTVTFLKCMQSMKQAGYDICEIGAVGPLYFYSKVANARVSRIFWLFEKAL
ncbi:MAG: GNAT family N-acetyltransferase [Armatimonadota bacterium]|nr:GNAT family N-acetyltransferase [Armatimonadota bacterium]